MANVRIITDATAYLEPEFVADHQITVLPIEIRFGDETFLIKADEGWDRFFQHIGQSKAQIAEASVPVGQFQEAYARLNRVTEEILVVPGSGQLSNVCAEARSAARSFLGRCRITVMDSQSASWGLGLLVRRAAEEAANGRPLDAIVRTVRGMLPHIYLIFFVERLDYLERRGRISPAQALLGTRLRIKPLLLVEDGEIMPSEKVRTRTAAIEKLVDFVAEFASVQKVVILRSPLENDLNELVAELREHLNVALPGQSFPVIGYDPVLACHLGPDALGVVVYEGL
jgi:DegV family protein with EDD domain